MAKFGTTLDTAGLCTLRHNISPIGRTKLTIRNMTKGMVNNSARLRWIFMAFASLSFNEELSSIAMVS
jgi:hypothetical protein